MPIVYWIEDEGHLLMSAKQQLVDHDCECREITLAAELPSVIEDAVVRPGPFIVDLWLPNHEVPGEKPLIGIDVGLWVLNQLREKLGDEWPILVLSGNLPDAIVARLGTRYAVQPDCIFFKPLIHLSPFVQAVSKQASRVELLHKSG